MVSEAAGIGERAATVLRVAVMFGRTGLWRPGPPARVARQLGALRRWGTTLGGSWISAAARDPGRPAIVDEYGTLTYGEVDARTDRLAAALGSGGGRPRVAVLCRNHRGMVETLVACGKLGSDVVLLNTGMGTEQTIKVLHEQEAEILVADSEFGEILSGAPGGVRTLTADGPGCDLAALIDTPVAADLRPPPRNGRMIVLSSGTTGRPKGAQRNPSPGLGALASVLSKIPLRVHETVQIEAPLFHTWGFAGLQIAIGLRATMVLRRRFDPEGCLRAAAGNRVTAMIAVPVMLQRTLEWRDGGGELPDLPALRVVAVSGSALPGGFATRFMDAFGDVLYNLYGSTEASWVTIATPEDLRAHPDTAGRPPSGTRLAILDDEGRPVPPGEVGRIFAANELLFAGYTSGATKETVDGMIGLGDLGRLDEHGRLFVCGRADDMIVSGGENVFPGEVEDVLTELPQVREAAVVGVPDAEWGQRLAAYVVLHPGQTLTADEVRDLARSRVARFAVPRDVHFVDELPRNATGKIVRNRLP
ncbi:AMP-binding protein [Thermomonospora amylolytica]|uniref:AMP-binding protein n=1 Tax=Thermomonospora amylolytica TaxID=1411117 RepID=UPI0018E52235|nr:AMP-binding protein [Thermomonospora amylolytica]